MKDKENKVKYQKEIDEDFRKQANYKEIWTVEDECEKFRETLI